MALGYLLGAIAACTYGMNPLFSLQLYADGMRPDMVLLLRYGIATPIVGVMLYSRGRSFRLPKAHILPMAILGVIVALSSLFLFLSYNYMAAGIASTILFVYPIMVAVIMICGYKEKAQLLTIACIALAVTGIGLLYNGSDGETLSLRGTIYVIISALMYAISIVMINKSRIHDKPTIEMTFWMLLFGAVLLFGCCCYTNSFALPSHPLLWLNVLGLAVFPTVISFMCTTRAINIIGSTPTAILGALEPVTALVIGFLVFDENLSERDIMGVMLILLAVTLIIIGASLDRALMRVRKLFPRLKRKH